MISSMFSRVNFKSVFFKYLSSSVLGSIVSIFAGFFTYRYIEPDKMGIWALFTVLELYATFTRFGVINGLGRELPFLLGKNENELARSYASTTLLYSLSSNLILIVLIPILFYFNVLSLDNEYYSYAFIVILFRLLFTSYTSYLSVTFRTSKSFSELSNIKIALTVIKLISILLVVFYGFWGLLARHFILSFSEMIMMHVIRPIKVSPSFNREHFLILIKVGFPLFVVSYLTGFIDTIPRLFLISFGTIEQLGLFSPFIIMMSTALLLPNAISSYMYPKMAFEFGKSNDRMKLWKIVKLTAIISFVSGLFIFICVYFSADYIHYIFPKYVEIIPYLKNGSIVLLFIGYKSAGISFSVLKSWNYMFLNLALYFLTTLLSILILYIFYDDILLIAVLSMSLTYFFMFGFSIYLSHRVTHKIIKTDDED